MNKAYTEIKELRDHYKNLDLHINEEDDVSLKRSKDMDFGQLVAYENVCKLLKIE